MQKLDDTILDSLEDLQWQWGSEKSKLEPILGDWLNYSNLVTWITTELKAVVPEIEETITPMKSNDDLPGFRMELSSLLNELRCPYLPVMNPSLQDRFESPESKKIVLSFLLSELEAGRLLYVNKTLKQGMKVELSESPTAKILRELCQELGLGKPPDSITAQAMWTNIINKVKGMGTSIGGLEPLFTGDLSPKQWSLLENYLVEFKSDYGMRREMLLKRLDVTIQSFHWSDRLKGAKEERMNEEFRKFRPSLSTSSAVVLSDVLSARADLAVVEKTSSTSVRKNTRSSVNSVVIGKVPDRGGRPNEVEPPPPEMPSWQQRQGGAPSGASGWIQNPNQRGGGQNRGGGGGGGPPRGGGGRVQGGWSNQRQQQQQQGSYQQQSSDNYHQGGQQQDYRGGHQQSSGGGYNQGGAGGYYQHDSRGDSFQDQGGNYYQDGGGDQRGQGQGYHRGGGRGGGRGRRY